MSRFHPAAALVLALAAVPAGIAMAAPDSARDNRPAAAAVTPANAPYGAPAAISAVYNAGYAAVRELEWEHGAWEVKALDANGRRVELRVDATTGAVTPHNH